MTNLIEEIKLANKFIPLTQLDEKTYQKMKTIIVNTANIETMHMKFGYNCCVITLKNSPKEFVINESIDTIHKMAKHGENHD